MILRELLKLRFLTKNINIILLRLNLLQVLMLSLLLESKGRQGEMLAKELVDILEGEEVLHQEEGMILGVEIAGVLLIVLGVVLQGILKVGIVEVLEEGKIQEVEVLREVDLQEDLDKVLGEIVQKSRLVVEKVLDLLIEALEDKYYFLI
ncbi:MAG: hypothetical protein ACI9P9_000666 [Patescibacteria group bacterium]|jgi:hypothetical protein